MLRALVMSRSSRVESRSTWTRDLWAQDRQAPQITVSAATEGYIQSSILSKHLWKVINSDVMAAVRGLAKNACAKNSSALDSTSSIYCGYQASKSRPRVVNRRAHLPLSWRVGRTWQSLSVPDRTGDRVHDFADDSATDHTHRYVEQHNKSFNAE